MTDELQRDFAQRLEQVISTVFACRSVVKYNSVLDATQKDELIADIDISLCYLRTGFTRRTSKQMMLPQPQFQQVGRTMSISALEGLDNDTHSHNALQELYRVYHAYIDAKQSNNIGTFVVRFDGVVSSINEIQHILDTNRDICIRPSEDPLHRIRTFIVDIYYMFMELVRTLSNALEDNDVHVDTEKISSMQQYHLVSTDVADLQMYIAPLSNAFSKHQRFNQMKGTLSLRISDSRAFIIFMRESLERDFDKRNEILVHLNSVAVLLEDLAYVLAAYEDAASLLLESSSDKRQ